MNAVTHCPVTSWRVTQTDIATDGHKRNHSQVLASKGRETIVTEGDEDSRLIAECLRGSSDAYAALVRKYQDRIYNTVLRVTGNAEDARELVQDAFVQAYRALDRFQGDSAFYTWLYRIAV